MRSVFLAFVAPMSFVSILMMAAPAAAQNVVYDPVTRVGAAVIDRVVGGPGGFDRCRAIFKGADGELIFHFHKERFYSVTVPGPKGMTNVPLLVLELGRGRQNLGTDPGSGSRIRAKLNAQQVEQIRNTNGRFVVWVGDAVRQEWAVANMKGVFSALEDCTNQNASSSARAPAPPPASPAPARPAAGKQEPVAANVPGWRFTSELEPSGYVNCRAITNSGGLEAIVAQRNNGVPYMSIAAQGLRGKFPNSSIVAKGITWQVMAEANGERLWFTGISANAVELIMSSGMYEFVLSNGQRNSVDLTRNGAAAWASVRRCVKSALGQ